MIIKRFRRIILIILGFLILGCTSNKPDFEKYDKLVWKAMLQYQDKEYKKALENFQDAFAVLPDENVTHYFYAAAAALHLGKENEAKELIVQSIIHTKASQSYFSNFKEFNQFRQLDMFEEIGKEYENYIAEFYSNLEHPDIYREIDSLVEKDQEVRTTTTSKEQFQLVDSLNINRLIEITQEYGWQEKGWLILWHQRGTYKEDNYVWNFFLPHINREIRAGTVRKDFWAMYEDEEAFRNGEPHIYGTYYDQFPIRDIENVDARRDSIGLPPLWYINKIYGIELPANYEVSENDENIKKL